MDFTGTQTLQFLNAVFYTTFTVKAIKTLENRESEVGDAPLRPKWALETLPFGKSKIH